MAASFGTVVNVRNYGLSPSAAASTNASRLQSLIDAYDGLGAALVVDQVYPCDPITLKKNVSLVSLQGPRLKGPYPAAGGSSGAPGGGGFSITNTSTPFITVIGANSVENLLFYYPSQVYSATTIGGTTTYPPTIANGQAVLWNANISGNCFVGPTTCIDLNYVTATEVADLVIDLNYGYPAGGYFIRLNNVQDIARITRNHINPGAGSRFVTPQSGNVIWTAGLITDIVENGTATFDLTLCDEFMMEFNFCYGVRTAFKLTDTYGSMSQCEVDQADTGVQFTPNTSRQYKVLHLNQFTYFPYSFSSSVARNGVIFDGVGGYLKAMSVHGVASVSTANSLIKVAGSGSQVADVASATTVAINSGVWTHDVYSTNGSATLNEWP